MARRRRRIGELSPRERREQHRLKQLALDPPTKHGQLRGTRRIADGRLQKYFGRGCATLSLAGKPNPSPFRRSSRRTCASNPFRSSSERYAASWPRTMTLPPSSSPERPSYELWRSGSSANLAPRARARRARRLEKGAARQSAPQNAGRRDRAQSHARSGVGSRARAELERQSRPRAFEGQVGGADSRKAIATCEIRH